MGAMYPPPPSRPFGSQHPDSRCHVSKQGYRPASAVSGAGGGIVALLATYPLMTINTVQATRGRRKREAVEAEEPAAMEPLNVLAELKHVRCKGHSNVMTAFHVTNRLKIRPNRAFAVCTGMCGRLWAVLVQMVQTEGVGRLYSGIWCA